MYWLSIVLPTAFVGLYAAQKYDAKRVREALALETKQHNRKLDEIHALVNSDMAKQKKLAVRQAERIAALTKDPKDVELAKEAKILYDEHLARQDREDDALAKKLSR